MVSVKWTGLLLVVLAAGAGCKWWCPPPPPPPPPPQNPDMASAAVDPCGGLTLNNNDFPRQGPDLNGTVVGAYCYLMNIAGVTSATTPLPTTASGNGSRTDGSRNNVPVSLTIAPPLQAGWSKPDPASAECGNCTAISPAPPLYSVTYTAVDGARPLCPGGRDALLIRNFNLEPLQVGVPPPPVTYTFACPGSALWHCALDWGFDPANEPLFKTCLRAERADFCGDGNPNTVVGVPLFLSSNGGHPSGAEWASTPEAVWGPDGARCVNTPRVPYRGTGVERVRDFLTRRCSTVLSATPCAIPSSADAAAQNLLLSYPLGVGTSPLCDHGQACATP